MTIRRSWRFDGFADQVASLDAPNYTPEKERMKDAGDYVAAQHPGP
jgi:hypothetical protein